MLSAAATLQKSLPPTSGKKSPFKSAKKIRAPTPRQSRSKEVTGACPSSSLKAVCNEVVEEVAVVEEAEVAVVVEEVEVVVVAVKAEVAVVVVEAEVAVEAEVVAEEAEVVAVVEEAEVAVVVEEVEVAVVAEEAEVEVVAEEAEVVAVVEEVAEVVVEKSSDQTPARSTGSKVSTPSIPAPSEELTVKKTRSTLKGTALASVPEPSVPEVVVATESVFDFENTAVKAAESIITTEPEMSTVTKRRQKRGVAVEIISTTKRSRRVQDAISAESSSVIPDNVDFADPAEEVREVAPAVAVDPTPIKSIGKVLRSSKKTSLVADVPVEEVKVAGKGRGKGKATKGVMQAIELEEAEEEDEEELEEALALLCDG